jgi:hypothetical protein
MNAELSKAEVLNLLRIWKDWMTGPDPSKNIPIEFKSWDQCTPKGLNFPLGILLHLCLWLVAKFGLLIKLPSLTVWAAEASVKNDRFWWEPISCGLNNSYTDMGLAYLQKGNIEKSIECLSKSWRIYPCPHNMSFGLKLTLFNKLREHPEAKAAIAEYDEMWKQFKMR